VMRDEVAKRFGINASQSGLQYARSGRSHQHLDVQYPPIRKSASPYTKDHPAVRLARNLRDQGLSLGKISQALFREDHKTFKGTAFSAAQVQSFIRLSAANVQDPHFSTLSRAEPDCHIWRTCMSLTGKPISQIRESDLIPLRPERFVTKKIVCAACRIRAGRQKAVKLGNLATQRDWGWAPEYVEAMWRMLQQPKADDFVVATGSAYSLADFTAAAFGELGLDWHDHVELDNDLQRPSDIMCSKGDARKAHAELGWKSSYTMPDVVRMMVQAEFNEGKGGSKPT
jgi:GDP-mannose 4,6 dehydratase